MIFSLCAAILIESVSIRSAFSISNQARIVRKVGARDIEVSWPVRDTKTNFSRRTLVGNRWVFGGYKGEILDANASDDAWSTVSTSVSTGRQEPTATHPWRVKVFVVTRADILNRGDYLRPRRGFIDKPEIEHLYQSLARASVAIEAKSQGRILPTFDVEIDNAEDFEEASPGLTPFDVKWLSEYLAPRINSHDFKSDDKIFRGPWDSVWVVHAGLVDRTPAAFVNEMPADAIPFFANGVGAKLSETMAMVWERDVVAASRTWGYGLGSNGSSPLAFQLNNPFPTSWLGSVSASKQATSEQFLERRAVPIQLGVPWKSILQDWPRFLRSLISSDLSTIAGTPIVSEINSRGLRLSSPTHALPLSNPANSLDGEFELSKEASCLLRLGATSIWVVDSRLVETIRGDVLDRLTAHGVIEVQDRCCLVFMLQTPKSGISEWELFGLPETAMEKLKPQELAASVFDGLIGSVTTTGSFQAEASKSNERAAVEIRMLFPMRQGSATLFDGYRTNQFIDAKQTPVFRFSVKATSVEPVLIRFESDSPVWQSPVVRLFGRWPVPEDGSATPAGEIAVEADGQWHDVVIDVRGLSAATGFMRVRRITLESDPLATIWGPDAVGGSSLTVGSMTCESAIGAAPTYGVIAQPHPDSLSTSKEARARWAFGATQADVSKLTELLRDRYSLVRINAASALARCKGTAVEAALAESLNTLDPRIAEQSMLALKAQSTEYAWAQILRFFNGPPAEGHRLFALKILGERKDAKSAGSLTASFAAPSWRTRLAGAEAIAAIGTEDANTLLMVFLQEANPTVRLLVVRSSDMKIEKVCRRILYTSVNDSSEMVRVASLCKLIEAPQLAFREEGYKGVRDESRLVRIKVLNFIEQHPNLESRQALQIGVADAEPTVKAAALEAWSTFPGEIKRDELADAFESKDVRVIEALDRLQKSKPIPPSSHGRDIAWTTSQRFGKDQR